MKILRKALLFLSIIALLSIFGVIDVSAADYTEGYYTYTVSNGEATITDVDEAISGDVTIPASLGGYPITTIGARAFENCASITTVVMPDALEAILSYAFAGCSNLTLVEIPDTVTYIGDHVFYDCIKLDNVSLPENIEILSMYLFYGCSNLKNVYIPAGVTAMTSGVFRNCSSLTNVELPNGITSISSQAFLNCSSLTSVNIPNGVTSIGRLAFSGCSSLTSLDIPDGVTSIGEYAFEYCSELTSLDIPDGVTSIGASAFYECGSLSSLNIPDGVTSIGAYTFYGCESLTSLDIPDGVTSIGAAAFYGCRSLTSLDIPDGVASISEHTFRGCSSLTSLDIPNGVTSIGASAFLNCSSLTSVNIPNEVTSIGESAFSGCSSLTSLDIPNGVTSIGESTFWQCVNLISVNISTEITSIGKSAFWGCSNLSTVNIPSGVTSIGDFAFDGCEKLTAVTLPEGLVTVGQYAFYGCCSIVSITVPQSVTTIGDHAFGCFNLQSIKILNPNTSIYDSEATITSGAVIIGYDASTANMYANSYNRTFIDINHAHTGVMQYDENSHWKECTICYEIVDCNTHVYENPCDQDCEQCEYVRVTEHDYSDWLNENGYHWYICTKCNETFSYELHSYDDNSDAFCNKCDYERTIFVVSYNANGGENAPLTSYIPLGSAATLSSDAPTKEGFVFVGWATDANGTVEYKAGETINLTESITLYAVWKMECQECYGTGQTYTTRSCTSCKSGYVYSSSCYYCYGRGKYSTGDMSCSNCYGSGQVKDPYGSGKYVSCLMCGGDGLVPDYQTCYYCRSKCTICNGSTKITDYFDCENCDAIGYFDSFEVHYDANGGSGAPSTQTMGGKTDTLSVTIPSREGFVFVGWNTLTDNNAVYQPGAVYSKGEVTFYAMWAPACHSCAGEGHFTAGNTCGSCNGNGSYNVTVKTCNSCGGNHVITHVTGYGTVSYCSNCGSTSVKTLTQTKTCSNCTNGIVGSTYECENCEGKGYLQTYPKALSFTDTKVVLLKIDGMEYSIDGINWQDSNIFTDLLPGMEYSFYQRMKATENAPFGFVSAPLLLRTDKADNESIPSTPVAIEITPESIRVEWLDGCEYSIDGVNWQSEPLFSNLDCATNYTVYARFAETDTHYASQAISYTVVRTEKGTVSAPSAPTLVAVGRDRVILQKLEGYEYSIDGIYWQSSNAFLGLESKTNYFFYCRLASTDRYYASAPSAALTVKTLAESETGPTYQITFQDEYGNILSQSSYELYDEVVIPSTLKESDLIYTYTFIQWDKPVNEFCMGEAVYTATYEKKYIDYEVIFKNENGDVISSQLCHYGDSVVIPTNPTKEADFTYTYTFAGWDNSVVSCAGDATYTATYTPTYIEYTVVFKDYDGETISSKDYHYGDTVTVPSDPTRAADNTYTYTFKSWDKEVAKCAGDATYTATYNSTYIDYTVIFKNEDGSVVSSKTYHYGDTVNIPEAPTKAADNTYTYTFAGWDSEVVSCNGHKTYTATYTTAYIEYTVVFKDWNGNVISSNEYHYGQSVTKPSNPTRDADNTYTYAFAGWDKTVTSCTESTVYTATYSSTYIEYEVVFKNYDGTILSTSKYHYGDTVVVPETPTKPADESYTYGFAGWDSEVTACLGNKTYIATFNPTNVEYTVVFKDHNGNVISSETYHFGDEVVVPEAPSHNADNTYTYAFKDWGKTVAETCVGDAEYTANYEVTYIEYNIKFLDWDGSLIQTVKYHYGDTITEIADPERASDETYTYTFLSWNKALGTCTGNASFTAQYESIFINYTVVFKDYDGSVISRKTYHFGDTITIPADPIRASDETYTYTFKDWGNISTSCNGNKEYTAVYNSEYIEYTVEFKDHNGNTLSSKTYHYGDEVVVPSDPAREADNTYTYAFADWDKEVVACVADVTYTATYTPTYINYIVVFKDYDGEVISTNTYHYGDAVTAPATPTRDSDVVGSYAFKAWDNSVVNCVGDATYTATYEITYTDYTVIFKNEDDTVLSTNTYHYGDEVIVPTTPTKASDNTYTYAFKAWDAEVVACAGNATYTATYDSAYIDYTVIFKNEDGTVLSTGTYHYGDAVTAPANPTKENDNDYTYIFKGWDKEIVACEGDATYTATYTATEIEDTTTPGTDTEPDINPDTDVNTPSDNDENDDLSGGAIAGIAAGSAVVVGGGGFALWWFVFRKKRII